MELLDVDILEILPPNLAKDKGVRVACEVFNKVLREVIEKIPNILIIPRLVRKEIVDNTLLDIMAWQLHCDFYETDMPIKTKQDLVLKSLDWHTRKGTPSVVEEIISTVFSRAKLQEWYEYGGSPYKFRIATDEEIPDIETKNKFFRAINSVKNTRSMLDELSQLIYSIDEITVNDCITIKILRNDTERQGKSVQHNGVIKYDGKTINKTLAVGTLYNGDYKYDGVLKYNKTVNSDMLYQLIPPFKYSSGILDKFELKAPDDNTFEVIDLTDEPLFWLRKHQKYNGFYKHEGAIKYDGMVSFNLEEE